MSENRFTRVNLKKSFKLIEEKTLYDEIQPTDKFFPNFRKLPIHERNNFFPRIKIVKAIVQSKKFIYLTASYVRSFQNFQVLLRDQYQLNQEDYQFLKNYQHQFDLQGKCIFHEDSMKHALVFLEKEAKQKVNVILKDNWLLPFLKSIQQNKMEYKKIKKIQSLLFSYWRQRRSTGNFPLFRPLWKNLNKSDLLYVYRPRSKKNIVKLSDVNQRSMAEQLFQQVDETSSICQNILVKQQLRLKKIYLQIKHFYQQVKGHISLQQYKKLISIDTIEPQSVDNRTVIQNSQSLQKDISTNRLHETEQQTKNKQQLRFIIQASIVSQEQKNLIYLKSIIPQSIFLNSKMNSCISNFDSRIQKCENLLESLKYFRTESKQVKQAQTSQVANFLVI